MISRRVIFLVFVGFSLLVLPASNETGSGYRMPMGTDFFGMEGTRVTHPLPLTEDSLSAKEILELQDSNGVTKWFARFFYKDICIYGICRMAKFWIFWDGAANYLGYQLHDNEPLTKSDHVDFLPADYVRLHEILADTASILKDLNYDDLAIEIVNEDEVENTLFRADAYSRATPPALSEYVVKDAVFTCYTLWQTVYGETRLEIERIFEERVNAEYLAHLFEGDNVQKMIALDEIKKNPILFMKFEPIVLSIVSSGETSVARKALSALSANYLRDPENQLKLVSLLGEVAPETRYEIYYKLQSLENVSPEAVLLLLDKHVSDGFGTGEMNQILRIISKLMVKEEDTSKTEVVRKKLIDIANSSSSSSTLVQSFLKSTR